MTGPSPITERVAEMRAAMAAQGPGPAGEAFARDRADLAAGGVPAGLASPGTVLRRGAARRARAGHHAGAVTGGGTSVLVFRGSWCPYYNIALSAYQAELLPPGRARDPARRDQPAEAGQVADHAGGEQPHLHRGLRHSAIAQSA